MNTTNNVILMTTTTAVESKTNSVSNFTALDWVVMALYMLGILGIGVFFWLQQRVSKNKTSSAYLAGQGMKIPTIVIALSIFATALSSLTFLATPGLAFKTGWLWSVGIISFLAAAPLIVKRVIPFYRRIKETTSYAYLEKRFHVSVRIFTSALFILFHLFRMAIVLYIPTLTLSLFVDINVYLILFIVSFVVVTSTFLGGYKGVLWTDAIQGIVLLFGIGLIIIFGLAKTDWEVAKFQSILKKSDLYVSLGSSGIFFLFISKYFENLYSYITSQDIVQRYKSSKSISKINKTIYINIGLLMIVVLLFYGTGSVLYSYYSSLGFNVDDPNAISVIVGRENAADNQLLSYFIIQSLPMGITGLLIAAIFAASQSTVSSSLNSIVTVITVDFISRFSKMKEKNILILSKILIASFGIIAFGVASLVVLSQQTSLIDYYLSIIGLFGMPVLSTFLLAMFTKRSNWIGSFSGIAAGLIFGLPIWLLNNQFIGDGHFKIHSAWVVLFTLAISSVVGYLISLLTNKFVKWKNITNLTSWTQTAEFNELVKLDKKLSKLENKLKKGLITNEEMLKNVQEYQRLEGVVSEQTE